MLSRGRRGAAGVTVLALISTGLAGWGLPAVAASGVTPAVAARCASSVPGDVNGDGQAEAVIGEPLDANGAGAVHVFYGQPDGLVADAAGTARNDQLFTQDSGGVPGAAEPGDGFGFSNVLADFNGDGCADLAAAAPWENNFTGLVIVLYGSAGGLTTAGAQSFTENSLFGAGSGVSAELFGAKLSHGDLNDDGVTDLVVGAPGEFVNGAAAGGAVAVIYGAAGGLGQGSTSPDLVSQASRGVPGRPENADAFGSALAVGDFDGHGVDDLAVGVPGENGSRGIVQLLPGQRGTGVGALPAVTYSQDTAGVPGKAEPRDAFGTAVAAGDVTADGFADLAVGAPGENGSTPEPGFGEGAVSFLRGSSSGLTGQDSQIWSQASAGVGGVPGSADRFGAALAMARLDNGPPLDLAIGAPGDSVGSIADAGSVTILLGRDFGLSTDEAGGQRFHQDTAGIDGRPEEDDRFGASVAAPAIQTTGEGSLLIGVPGETVNGVLETGLFHQLVTNEFGPSTEGSRTFHLDSAGVQGTPGVGDQFGFDVS
jgi:hypothetical protein